MNEHKRLQHNFKKTQRKAVLKLVALLLVVVILIMTVSWSWFNPSESPISSGDVTIQMASSGTLEIAVLDPTKEVPQSDWVWRSDWDLFRDVSFVSDVDLTPVTGLGYKLSQTDKYLYLPKLKYENGETSVDDTSAFTQATENLHYISLKIAFKTSFPADIYIGKGTRVVTESAILTGEDAGNKSLYGNFSRDAMVGALRMSVCVGDEGDSDYFLWIPQPNLKLEKDASGKYYLNTNAYTGTSSWAGEHHFYSTDRKYSTENNCAASADAVLAVEDKVNGADSRTMIGSTDKDTTCTAYLKIWIEGTDEEAVRALSGGRFKLELNFVAIEKVVTE